MTSCFQQLIPSIALQMSVHSNTAFNLTVLSVTELNRNRTQTRETRHIISLRYNVELPTFRTPRFDHSNIPRASRFWKTLSPGVFAEIPNPQIIRFINSLFPACKGPRYFPYLAIAYMDISHISHKTKNLFIFSLLYPYKSIV